MKLRGTGPLNESQRKIDEFLRDRAKKAVKNVKHWLGMRPGRIRDLSREKAWTVAASLRERNPKRFTWRVLASVFDRDGFQKNPQLAMDRIRHGVDAVLARSRQE
jgi:hypothetical protein